jgi:cohesin complex subunit SCC1
LPTHPAGDVEDPTTPKSKRKPPKEKKQIIDKVIYLKDGPGPKTGANTKERDVSSIVKKQQFLPPSALAMRFLEIRDDPLSHFMPTKTNQDRSFICLAPPGIAPELAELFMRPVSGTKRNRGSSPPKGAKKRKLDAGTAADDDDLPEDIRRAPSHAPSFGGRSDMQGGDQTFDFGDQPMVDDYQMDIPDISLIVGEDGRGASAHPTDRSRMSTPAADGFLDEEPSYADADCPIATFDLPSTQSQSQQEPEPADTDGKGYSKNTAKALSIVRRELQPSADDEEEKVLIFNKMADKVCGIYCVFTFPDLVPGVSASCRLLLLRAACSEHKGLHQGFTRQALW